MFGPWGFVKWQKGSNFASVTILNNDKDEEKVTEETCGDSGSGTVGAEHPRSCGGDISGVQFQC